MLILGSLRLFDMTTRAPDANFPVQLKYCSFLLPQNEIPRTVCDLAGVGG